MQTMISLYDYLGKPAGSALGKQVYAFSKIVKAKRSTKVVAHSPYKNGTIITYEKPFLDQFFKIKALFNNA
jgi:hypothetical protein